MDLDAYNWEVILTWDEKVQKYKNPFYTFKVRDKEIKIATHSESLSHSQIPKISLPKYKAWGDILKWKVGGQSGLRKTMDLANSLAHRTTWLRSDLG